MPGEDRPALADYADWQRARNLLLDGDSRRYEIDAIVSRDTCQNHPFFLSLDDTLDRIAQEYSAETGAHLFSNPRITLVTKSYESARNKAYRHNIVHNESFPDPPKAGWLEPNGWFTAFDDIVRCQLVCRYLDGPSFAAKRLSAAATASGLASEYSSVQHDRGYYAYHFYVKIPVDLIGVLLAVEIQLTTQLQDVVYDLTHGFYEELRVKERAAQRGDGWKWEYKTARFKAGYLSHTLHLLEGLIAEVRGEQLAHHAHEERNEPASEPEAADATGSVPPSDPQENPDRGA